MISCNSQTIADAAIVERLYLLADKLDRDWASARLEPEFGSRMVMAVLRFLEQVESASQGATSYRYKRERIAFAETLLRRFWFRNARRDAARYAHSGSTWGRGGFLSLDDVGEDSVVTKLHDVVSDDIGAGETGRTVADLLEKLGWSRKDAWAFVWRESGRDWEDVAFLIAERFGQASSLTQLRKWASRSFPRARAAVRSFFMDRRSAHDLAYCES